MTTKNKILAGFAIVVLIMGVVAFFGYSGLQNATNNFNEYRRLARFNVLTSEMVAAMNRALGAIYLFTTTDETKNLDEARSELKKISALVTEADEFISLPERRKVLEQLVANQKNLEQGVNSIEEAVATVIKQYSEVVLPLSHSMTKQVSEMHALAQQLNNTELDTRLMQAMAQLGTVRSSSSRFSQSRDDKDRLRALETAKQLDDMLKDLPSLMVTSQARQQFRALDAELDKFTAALDEMSKYGQTFQASLKRTDDVGDETVKNIGILSEQVNDDMIAQGTQTLDSNENTQRITMMLSVGGFILAVAFAAISILGLLRVLRELGIFSSEIAKGNFHYTVRVKERGEVGQMVDAMQQIPDALNSILAEYQGLEKDIENGNLGTSGDVSKFRGEFATLVSGTNAVISRFRMVLESIPTPVIMMNSDRLAVYMNKLARDWSSDDYRNKTISQLFATEDYDTANCSLRKAVETNQSSTSETRAHPKGKNMEISYTVIPMYNAEKKLSSILELMTDLTSIKETQRTIMNVAAQASEISSRVAAASEQLSAQVEQVSRGAEMQRSRVESTASAMTEMNATVLEVARNAGQASEQSEMTKSKANAGSEIVNKVVHATGTVNEVASQMHVNMQELGKLAEGIGGVMNVISDVADQTNLLALNAAIEAARAGEAGRGFAVVADEVRKLAERTMEATTQVGSNITAIQQSARVNIEAMGNASKAVGDATDLANASGEALAEILDLASNNSNIVASIATAAEEQSATSEEISNAINEINRIVGETSEGMIQASSAVQDLSQMAQELNHVMEQLK
ncbi:methyl-accepting chemotaxis protein [Desulfovibrio sp. OttesenSCG-928-G15]|nr:methyl-accepting chemotaxis protein [Desulfovibrio sp. OttesenSCG-928-G15]